MPSRPAPILAPASRVGNARRPHGVVVPRGRRVYRPYDRPELSAARIAAAGVALAAGVGCGVYYFTRGQFGTTALYLAGVALVAALIAPAWAMSLAVAEAIGVPLAYGVLLVVGAHIAFPPSPHFAATLLALLPTLTGAMFGLGLRWVFSGDSGSSLHP